MKTLFLITLILAGVATFAFAQNYSYESSVDPGEFPFWEVVKVILVPSTGGITVAIRNPAYGATPPGALIVVFGDLIVSYVYLEEENLKCYFLNDRGRYALMPLDGEVGRKVRKNLEHLFGPKPVPRVTT